MLSRFLDTEEQNIGLFVTYVSSPKRRKKMYTNRASFPILSSSDRRGLCKKQSLAMTLKQHKAGRLISGPEFWIHRFRNKITARRAKLAFDWYHNVVVMLVDNAQAITAHSASRCEIYLREKTGAFPPWQCEGNPGTVVPLVHRKITECYASPLFSRGLC
jgi:hypothetical protein